MDRLRELRPDSTEQVLFAPCRALDFTEGAAQHRILELSKELELFRPYLPGDSPRWIDWRSYARTEQLLVREVLPRVASPTVILLPHTSSWDWAAPHAKTTKTETFLRAALYLTHQEALKSHSVLWLLGSGRLRSAEDCLAMGFHTKAMAQEVFEVCLRSKFSWGELLKFGQKLSPSTLDKTYGRVILISDGLDQDFSQTKFRDLKSTNKTFLHILHSAEVSLSWCQASRLYEAPHEPNKRYEGLKLRGTEQDHQEALNQWRGGLTAQFQGDAWSYHSLTDESSVMDLHLALESHL